MSMKGLQGYDNFILLLNSLACCYDLNTNKLYDKVHIIVHILAIDITPDPSPHSFLV